jgi:Bacterial membrane protein YfhO
VLQSDSGFVFEPDGLLVRRALRAGGLPIWTTAMSAGLGPRGVVVSNPGALPPAFVAYGWRASQGRTASALLMAAGTARQACDAPVIDTAAKPPAAPPGAATPARVVSRTDTEVRLDVQAQADGHVVLLDTFYPGWHAEVDGREQPIRAADLAFRAVAVTPGRHTVRFFYRPTSVLAGGALSLAALLAIGVCLIGLRRRGGSERAA